MSVEKARGTISGCTTDRHVDARHGCSRNGLELDFGLGGVVLGAALGLVRIPRHIVVVPLPLAPGDRRDRRDRPYCGFRGIAVTRIARITERIGLASYGKRGERPSRSGVCTVSKVDFVRGGASRRFLSPNPCIRIVAGKHGCLNYSLG